MISDEMIKYRAKERINQQELADRCGLSRQTICSIENNLQEPSRITLEKIKLVIDQKEE